MPESSAAQAALDRECANFCRYLVDHAPSANVLSRYRAAHSQGVVETAECSTRFDRALVSFARHGSLHARLSDAHARLFCPAGLLRRKLVLALALLETDAQSHRRVDLVSPGSRLGFLLRCVGWALGFLLQALLGLLIFLPMRLLCSLRGKGMVAT